MIALNVHYVISLKRVFICLSNYVIAPTCPIPLGPFYFFKIGMISVQITLFATMVCETFNQDLEMINAGCCSPDSPLTTQFLLPAFEGNKLYPRFYGRIEDKKKVYHALKEDMHAKVQTKWGELKCHCSRIPIIRLSKTARNLNKVFLTCGTPATADTRCKYFQWIHTPLFIDKRPIQNLKYATKLTRGEWMQQALANVEKWKQQNGWYKVKKQDAQTQTEWGEEKQKQAWLNQFAESAKKQEEQRKSRQVIIGRPHHCQVPFI